MNLTSPQRVKDPVLLWLWCRPVATALIRPLWEPPYAANEALKDKETKKKKKVNVPNPGPFQIIGYTDYYFFFFFFSSRAAPSAYESSQGRGPARATAAGLHQHNGNSQVFLYSEIFITYNNINF